MIFSGRWLRLILGFVSRTGTCRFRIETHVHHRSDDFASVHTESSHHFVSGPVSQLRYRDPTTMGIRMTTQTIRSLFGVTKTMLDGNFSSPVFIVSFHLFLPLCSLVSLHGLYSSLVSFFTCSSLVLPFLMSVVSSILCFSSSLSFYVFQSSSFTYVGARHNWRLSPAQRDTRHGTHDVHVHQQAETQIQMQVSNVAERSNRRNRGKPSALKQLNVHME